MASAGVSVLVLFVFRLPAVLVPGRLEQARHRAAAAAAAADAVVTEAADHKRPAFSLFGRAPHPQAPPPGGGVTG